jgi:hypothetical protein
MAWKEVVDSNFCGNKEFHDLENAYQVSTFTHLEFLFWELVNLDSLFRVLLEGVFL